jgi:hypothetical protein
MLSVATSQPTMHRGLSQQQLRDCTQCHAAHQWKIARVECSDCHADLNRPMTAFATRFDHARHVKNACAECHDTQTSHGQLNLSGALDCMGCHHDPARPAAQCKTCHTEAELAAPVKTRISMQLSVGSPKQERELAFQHSIHVDLECSDCHDSASLHQGKSEHLSVDCASCHDYHHVAGNDCSSCHPKDLKARHDRSAHVSCSAAGCHAAETSVVFDSIADACLVCHSDRRDHEPDSNCRSCHFPTPSNGDSSRR